MKKNPLHNKYKTKISSWKFAKKIEIKSVQTIKRFWFVWLILLFGSHGGLFVNITNDMKQSEQWFFF
jgi:hypothetical protein